MHYHNYDQIIQKGETPVYIAAERNRKECMELLLSRAADANTKDYVSSNDNMNL